MSALSKQMLLMLYLKFYGVLDGNGGQPYFYLLVASAPSLQSDAFDEVKLDTNTDCTCTTVFPTTINHNAFMIYQCNNVTQTLHEAVHNSFSHH